MSESIVPDLDGSSCSVTDCIGPSDTIGAASVRIPAMVGAV